MLATLLATALALAGCSGFEQLDADPPAPTAPGATVAMLDTDVLLGDEPAVQSAVAASQAFFATSGIVVLTASDGASQLRAASIAMLLGVPALLVGRDGTAPLAVVAELERLGTHTVLTVGDVVVPELSQDRPMLRAVQAPASIDGLQVVLGSELDGEAIVADGGELQAVADAREPFSWLLTHEDPEADASASPDALADLPGLPPTLETERLSGVVVVAERGADALVALGTARAAGAGIVLTDGGEIAQDPLATAAVFGLAPQRVVGVGDVGPLPTLSYRIRVAASGVDLPGGGQLVLPGKLYVSLRGLPGDATFGPLGDQDQAETFARLTELAGEVDAAVSAQTRVVPTAEVVTTSLAGGSATRHPVDAITEFAEAAGAEGVAVLLAFQPGRESFVDQLMAYGPVLALPNVGVVLEPRSWLGDGDGDIAAAVTWLADLVAGSALPPKLVVVRDPAEATQVVTDRPEVELVVEVDGSPVAPEGPTPAAGPDGVVPDPVPAVTAEQVWSAVVSEDASDDVAWWGWRQGENAATVPELLALDPRPVLISSR